MFCPHCGKEIADGSYICPHCNQTVEAPQQQAQPQQQQYNPQYQQFQQPQYNVPNQPVSGKKNICATLGLVFGIVGGACALISFIMALTIISTLSGTVGLVYLMLALTWIALPLLIAGLALSIAGVALAKKYGHQGMAIAGLIVSVAFFIFWFFVI